METGNSRWFSPPSGLVERVVKTLKQRGSWVRDGASLRQLNSQWCLKMNQHVLSIRPRFYSLLKPLDIRSLKKFPRLKDLDISGFLKALDESEIGVACFVLSRLMSLRYLEISETELEWLGPSLKWLTKLSWIKLKSNGVATFSFAKLKGLRLQKLSCICDSDFLATLKTNLPQLEELEATFTSDEDRPFSPSEVDSLNSLQSLHLRIVDLEALDDLIGKVTSLVSLDVQYVYESRHLDALSKFPSLKNLSLSGFFEARVLNSESFCRTLTQLTSLSLKSIHFSDDSELMRFIENPINLSDLKSLVLENFCVYETEVVQTLHGLTSLIWTGFESAIEIGFLASFCRLKSLCLVDVHCADWHPFSVPLDHETFPDLTSLTFTFGDSPLEWFQLVSKLSKLEVLGMFYQKQNRIPQRPLDFLLNLRQLHTLGIELSSIVTSETLEDYSKLWDRLESLCPSIMTRKEPVLIKDLRNLAPHLNIDCVRSKYDFYVQFHQLATQ